MAVSAKDKLTTEQQTKTKKKKPVVENPAQSHSCKW